MTKYEHFYRSGKLLDMLIDQYCPSCFDLDLPFSCMGDGPDDCRKCWLTEYKDYGLAQKPGVKNETL